MKILIFGGAGFVGLNIAAALLVRRHDVTLFDRAAVPPAAVAALGNPSHLKSIVGDVTDASAVAEIVGGHDAIVLGAAITAGAVRDAADPEAILAVNLLAQTPILRAAREAGVDRIINLSSAAAYGNAGLRHAMLDEETPCDPISLYSITKFASERVCARLAMLWNLDVVNVRLSGVFGPFERPTGVRDTLSPHAQVLAAFIAGKPALLERPGLRDWVYATDVAEAVATILEAKAFTQRLFNISSPRRWSVLEWGQALAALWPGGVCRLAEPGEAPTIDLHSALDRAPLSTTRLSDELGWQARFGCADSAADLHGWWRHYGTVT